MAGFATTNQSDFSKGAHVGLERVPDGGVQDCVNGLYQDDGTIAKRGGCSYLTTSDTSSTYGDLRSVWAGQLVGGESVVVWSAATASQAIWRLNDGTSVLDKQIELATSGIKWGRPVGVGGAVAIPRRDAVDVIVYAGSDKPFVSQTMTFTNGSATVTGSGSSFDTDAEPGTLIVASTRIGIVKSVESATSLTLNAPWSGSGGAIASYFIAASSIGFGVIPEFGDTVTADTPAPVIGTIFGRLLLGVGNRLYFSPTTDTFNLDAVESYHEFPDGVAVTGIDAVRDAAIVFTTDGVWSISGMAFDLTDDYGNPQHRVERLNRDLVLWSDMGIASVADGVVAPALDDIYVLSTGGAKAIGGGIRKTYREYIRSGYIPGQASVHRGHYVLPILNPSSDDEWVDTLVCDLTNNAWARWDGYTGKVRALTQRIRSGVPTLIATAGAGSTDSRRLANLTNCFEPGAANNQEADASNFNLVVTFRTQISGTIAALWTRFRLLYQLTDANSDNPTVTADYQTGPPNNTWTSLTGSAAEAEDGVQYWRIGKRSKTLRVRVTSSGPSAKLVIRAAEWMFRQTGRK